jgi:hypothetical protein
MAKELENNKLCKFRVGFFSEGKAAEPVDTGGINGFCQRSMPKKRQVKCASYSFTVPNSMMQESFMARIRAAASQPQIGSQVVPQIGETWNSF